MSDLKLPVFKGEMKPARILSMDEYLRFVMFNLRETVDRARVRQLKRKGAVNVAFKL